MSKIIDYLQEIDLLEYQKIDDYFFTTDIDTINTLVDHISTLANEDWTISEYSPYSFSPSMDISGFGGCVEIGCKIKRASTFSKFASLYGDTIYLIINSIANPHFINPDIKNEDSYDYRYSLICDFSLISLYSELIKNHIAKIIPTQLGVCPDCFLRHIGSETDLTALEPLVNKYASKAIVSVVEYDKDFNDFCVEIKNLPELFPDHDTYINIKNENDLYNEHSTLPSKVDDFSFKYKLIKNLLHEDFLTSKLETFTSSIYNSKYITSKFLHKDIIDITSKSTRGSILLPMFEMPFLEQLDIPTALKLRESEYHAFNDYRIALDNATKEYVRINHDTQAKEIYDDIIYPAFTKLDAMFERTKKMNFLKNASELFITSAAVTLGVMNSVIPKNATAIITASCGTKALTKLVSDAIERKLNAGNELEKQDFYFLWKLKRKM